MTKLRTVRMGWVVRIIGHASLREAADISKMFWEAKANWAGL